MHTNFPCKRCGSPVPAGAQAQLLTASCATPIALDRACPACGHRALYRAHELHMVASAP